MLPGIEIVKPEEIEKKSFEILSEILGDVKFPPLHEPIIKRVIHTTADFEYASIMNISEGAMEKAMEAIRGGCNIVTDTNMAAAGINKKVLGSCGGKVVCLMADGQVAAEAAEKGITRAAVSMDIAVRDPQNRIFVIGNAPTALIRLYELVTSGQISPALVVGVPVGFVNVVESKELIKKAGVPFIVSDGRKGGSTVAAAIVNAILYTMCPGD